MTANDDIYSINNGGDEFIQINKIRAFGKVRRTWN
jgi:hypothetical protein